MFTSTVIASLVLMFAVGAWSARYTREDAESFFLGDRTLGRWTIALSAGAAANTGFVVTAAVGMGYSGGASAILYPLAWLLGDLAFWTFFARPMNELGRQSRSITASDLIATAVPASSIRMASAVIVIALLTVYASAQITATQKAVSAFYDFSPEWVGLGGLAFVLAYTTRGGFRSSVWTDVAQGIFMAALPVIVLLWIIKHVGGFGPLLEGLRLVDQDFLNIGSGKSAVAVAVFVAGFAFTGFGFSLSQPQVMSRIMAGRDDEETRSARWIYIAFLQWTWTGMCIVGMCIRVVMPDIEDHETALPQLANAYFHPILAGFVLAAMLAAIQSSLSAFLVSAGSSISLDLAKASHGSPIYYGSIIATGVISYMLVILIEATVFQASLLAATILAASIAPAVVIAVLRLKTNEVALLTAVSVGIIVAVAWRLAGIDKTSDAMVGFAAAMLTNAILTRIKDYSRV